MKFLYLVFLETVVLLGIAFLRAPGSVLIVLSGSMAPVLNAGDLIINRRVVDVPQPGTIITYEHEGKLITHRVVEVFPDGLRTKGDANSEPDAWLVPFTAVRGVAWIRVRYVGYVVSYLRTQQGWFVGVILPAILIILHEMLVIVQEILRSPPRKAVT